MELHEVWVHDSESSEDYVIQKFDDMGDAEDCMAYAELEAGSSKLYWIETVQMPACLDCD